MANSNFNALIAITLHHALRTPVAIWLGRVVVIVFCLGFPAAAAADTNFGRMIQTAHAKYGQKAATTIRDWQRMIESGQHLSDIAKVRSTNNFVNRHALFEEDIVVYNQVDYWATPLELFGNDAGDCEDFAIAKYVTLRLLNVPVRKLRMVYVRATVGYGATRVSRAHMVLSYYETPGSDPLILDNLTNDVLPAKQRPDLFPVFSFNHDGLWVQGEQTPSANPISRLSRWRDVLQRMRLEGIDPQVAFLSRGAILAWVKGGIRVDGVACRWDAEVTGKCGPAPRQSLKKTLRERRAAKRARAAANAPVSRSTRVTKSKRSLRRASRR